MSEHRRHHRHHARMLGLPRTTAGWLAFGFVLFFVVWTAGAPLLLHGFDPDNVFGLIAGVLAGVIGLTTVVTGRERSLLVWLGVLCGAIAVVSAAILLVFGSL